MWLGRSRQRERPQRRGFMSNLYLPMLRAYIFLTSAGLRDLIEKQYIFDEDKIRNPSSAPMHLEMFRQQSKVQSQFNCILSNITNKLQIGRKFCCLQYSWPLHHIESYLSYQVYIITSLVWHIDCIYDNHVHLSSPFI